MYIALGRISQYPPRWPEMPSEAPLICGERGEQHDAMQSHFPGGFRLKDQPDIDEWGSNSPGQACQEVISIV